MSRFAGAGVILRTIASPPADVSIVPDAASKGMLSYQPTTFTGHRGWNSDLDQPGHHGPHGDEQFD